MSCPYLLFPSSCVRAVRSVQSSLLCRLRMARRIIDCEREGGGGGGDIRQIQPRRLLQVGEKKRREERRRGGWRLSV